MRGAVVTPDRPLRKPTRESHPFGDGLREGKFMSRIGLPVRLRFEAATPEITLPRE